MGIDTVLSRIVMTAMILAAGVGIAEAASSVCTRLESQLASLQRSQNAGANRAASQQANLGRARAELNAANSEARRAGCKGGFLQFKSANPAPQCASLLKRIDSIQARIDRAEQASRGADPAASGRQRADILRLLGQNDCGPQYASYVNAGQRPRNFFERLFNPDNRVYVQPQQGDIARVPARDPGRGTESAGNERGFGGGNYRTLCVRTCDGYYFPISFATRRSNFATDEATCRQMCPGTDVALYAHRNPGQNSTDARSVTDETPYSALSTAFSYRTSFNPSCTCGSPTSLQALNGGYSPASLAAAPADEAMPPVPGAAPFLGEDPETLANRAGQLAPDDLGTANVETPVAGLPSPPRSAGVTRRVGPSYFYAQ
ncbi:hypothetical protein K32_28800 [Kaistia sp. 32K]|uniref:DUF2865 domain-containing protein n=1 Tax=Kaistia sp. 32K TaxID=2795690 RepID=UPI001915FE2C|nr:DUF2865 domain-containing protein [Kaistia sp. 32K]BCP54263.1 hypothetical protein K32_28800 [Kaistia sp. 32K]